MKKEVLELKNNRLAEAEDSIREAEVLLKEGMSMRAVMNRIYYAMFYAVLALLQEKGMGTSRHAGAISLFDREFIKKGVFDEKLSKILHRAFELRQTGDYMEQVEVTRSEVDEMLPETKEFVRKVRMYLLT